MLELAPLLVSAMILGLLGGGHCLGMCGGLMGALTFAIPKEQRSRRFKLLLAYNLVEFSAMPPQVCCWGSQAGPSPTAQRRWLCEFWPGCC